MPGTEPGLCKIGNECSEKEEMQHLCDVNGTTEQCCREHRRRLELFCQDDEAFVCVLCVPRHSSHSFVFLHDAVRMYKDKLKLALLSLEVNVKHHKHLEDKTAKDLLDLHENASSLEQYITQEFTKLHHFLYNSEQKLLQQLKNKAVLKEMEENLDCIKNDVMLMEEVKENIEYIKNYVMATREALLCDMLEPGKEEAIVFLTIPETFEDVTVTFSEEEWKTLRKEDKELHRDVMMQNYELMTSVAMTRSTGTEVYEYRCAVYIIQFSHHIFGKWNEVGVP